MSETNAPVNMFMGMIEDVMEIPEESLSEETVSFFKTEFENSFTSVEKEAAINEIISNCNSQNMSRRAALASFEEAKKSIRDLFEELKPSKYKQEILDFVFNIIYDIYESVIERYHISDITLPITLEEGATAPTYAHEDDAAADLYALEDTVVSAHSFGNMIKTGVRIGLPENWVAFILPRSSIGSKTPLRLSNSIGVIDSGYRGPLGILYDNLSDSDYTIHAGDRIAQLLVRPSYHFTPKVVETLDETERGEGGFGSSGK